MTTRKLIPLLIATLCSSGAFGATDVVDTAQVISATPIYERISEPRQECNGDNPLAPQPK